MHPELTVLNAGAGLAGVSGVTPRSGFRFGFGPFLHVMALSLPLFVSFDCEVKTQSTKHAFRTPLTKEVDVVKLFCGLEEVLVCRKLFSFCKMGLNKFICQ